LLNWLVGQTVIFGITIENWILLVAGIFILWIVYLIVMSPLKE
jgi:hypothetical protein